MTRVHAESWSVVGGQCQVGAAWVGLGEGAIQQKLFPFCLVCCSKAADSTYSRGDDHIILPLVQPRMTQRVRQASQCKRRIQELDSGSTV